MRIRHFQKVRTRDLQRGDRIFFADQRFTVSDTLPIKDSVVMTVYGTVRFVNRHKPEVESFFFAGMNGVHSVIREEVAARA